MFRALPRRQLKTVTAIPWAEAAVVPFPSFLSPKINKIAFKRTFQVPLEINVYPATPPVPEQPLTAFLAPTLFRRTERRQLETLLPLDEYLFRLDTPTGVLSFINSDPTGASSTINDDPTGVASAIVPNVGILSFINSDPTGVTSTINSDPTGVASKIS